MEPLALSGGAQSPGHHHGAHLHRPLMHHQTWGFPPGAGSPPVAPSSSSYEASVVATSLLPPGDAWAHHPMLATPAPANTQHWVKEEHHCPSAPPSGNDAHDDSGISPGRTSSSGPPSSGGSPPASEARGPDASAPSPPQLIKNEHQDAEDESRSSPVTHEDDSSETSEDTMDSLSRLQMALSQSGSPLGDIYNAASEEQNTLAIQCPLCSHVATSLPSLAAHLNLHVEQKSGNDASDLQCAFCVFATSSRDEFMTHLSSHYPNNDISVTSKSHKSHSVRRCSVCDFATKSGSKLKAHLAEFHGFDPGENEMEMTDEDVNLPRVNSQGKVKTFRCKQCNFVAVTKLDFWSHSRSHIKCEKMLSCPRCPFVTEYKHHLEYHLRNHSGSKPFKCSQCSYSCVNKSMLNSHLKSHSNVYQYRCSDCNYATKYCHSLKLHLRKYTHSPAMVLNPDGSPNPLPIIDVYGTRRGPKTKRENSSHEPQTNSTSRREKSPVMSSPYPNVTMNQPYLVNPSPAIIDDPHKCVQCEFSTASQENFAQHLLTAHQNGTSKSRSPPILIPTPEKIIQPTHPIMIPQPNPMKEYLSWVYAQQQHAMDLYQQYKGSIQPDPVLNLVANPLDLSKEVKKPEPLVNNNITPPAQTSTSKNRRKGKAFKLERIAVQHDDTDDDLKPPPNKIRNNGAHLNESKELPPKPLPTPPALELTPLQLALKPSTPPQPPESQPLHPQSNGVVKNVNEPSPKPPSTDEIKPEIPPLVATMNGAPPSPFIASAEDQPTYNCSYCDILFRDVVMYTMHMGYHGYKDPFHCNMCGQQTADKLSFFLHIARSSHS